jgi:hypothetical protein
MRHHRQIAYAAAMLAWTVQANAAPPEQEPEVAAANRDQGWIVVDARNHVSGATGAVAVLFGSAQERGRSRPAMLRVDCFDKVTTLHVDTAALRLGASEVTVTYSLDGGPFRYVAWQAGTEGNGIDLPADRAVPFLAGLYDKVVLRLAIVRPLSVPFLLTFTVAGAEQGLSTVADRCQWAAAQAISEVGR